jgi:hypothetical protein
MSSSYVVVVEDITEYLFLIPAKIIALLHASPSVLERCMQYVTIAMDLRSKV